MWSDRVPNPEPLTLESDALPIALHGPARRRNRMMHVHSVNTYAVARNHLRIRVTLLGIPPTVSITFC